MKVYLDDERQAPQGWVQVRWPEEAIALLKIGKVTEISLDHDLGNDDRGTGYDVVLWIEEAVVTEGFVPPKIKVHSANSSARIKMELGIKNIKEKAAQNESEVIMSIKTNHTLKPLLDGEGYTCNKCGKSWDTENYVEENEKLHKHDIGGYASVFGDQQEWSVTLCQECALEVLSPYIKWGQYFE